MSSGKSDMVREAAFSAPPVGVAGATLLGYPLQDWVLGATLLWLTIQMGWWGYQRVKEWRGVKNAK